MPNSPPASLLEIRALDFAWPDGAPLFAGLALDVAAGVTFVQGDIGCGKTTLLRLVSGDLRAAGRIALRGRRRDDDPAAWRRDVCLLDVADARLDAVPVADLPAALARLHGSVDAAVWRRHVAGFDLGPHLAKPLAQLSTGTRRKAGLAAVLSLACPLTLLDEPAAGLDAASRRHLASALAEAASDAARAWLVVDGQLADALPGRTTITLPARECT